MNPRHAITTDQMYAIEENGDSRIGMKRYLMMENAGHGVADYLADHFKGSLGRKKIVAVCGIGNNGGDGFVASRHLAGRGFDITVVLLGSPDKIRSEEARLNWSILQKMSKSIKLIVTGESLSKNDQAIVLRSNVIIDAMFGTGVKGGIREPYSTAIDAINSSKAFKLAVDVPSGFDPNSGKPLDKCVKADVTITFHRLKVGLKRGRQYTGRVILEYIGIPLEAELGVLD